MADESTEIVFKPDTPETALAQIINNQIDILHELAKPELDFSGLYDANDEDRIKCVKDCFAVIKCAQEALIKQIEIILIAQ